MPAELERAHAKYPPRQRRPAAFLDRDGVFNHDEGYVGAIDRFRWIDRRAGGGQGAQRRRPFRLRRHQPIRASARGYYSEADMHAAARSSRIRLAERRAPYRRFPSLPLSPGGGRWPNYRRVSDWRKPEPGMILDLMQNWPVDPERSFLIGDKASDIAAGGERRHSRASVPGRRPRRVRRAANSRRATRQAQAVSAASAGFRSSGR